MLFSTVYDDIASYFRNVFDARIQHASYVLLALVELVAQHILVKTHVSLKENGKIISHFKLVANIYV